MDILVRVLPALTIITLCRPVEAKPRITVVARVSTNDGALRDRMTSDVHGTLNDFLADRFIEELSKTLKMFEYVKVGPSQLTITLELRSMDQPWPLGNVSLVVIVAGYAELLATEPVFHEVGCPMRPCFPSDFSKSRAYQASLHALLQQWPNTLSQVMKVIPVSTKAGYDHGKITTRETVTDLGESDPPGSPSVLFDIAFGTSQYMFAICKRLSSGGALGKQQATPMLVSCSTNLATGTERSAAGTVTVNKVMP
jgi:hypothetical protein